MEESTHGFLYKLVGKSTSGIGKNIFKIFEDSEGGLSLGCLYPFIT